VAHRAGRRWLRRFERIAVPSAASLEPPLRRGGVCLITGGLGGMGLAFARWLGAHAGAKLLLTARTALPARAQWDDWLREHPASERHAAAILAIRDIEAAGGEVLVAVADAADAAAMAHAIDAAHGRWGPLNGVIHAAGIAGNGGIALMKSADESRAVLAPKVEGLDVLVQLLGRSELDFVALMSSINAVIGAPGTCDYASANAYLDAFPESVQRPACWQRVVAFDWSAWRDVGMAANLVVPESRREQWRAHLASAIPPAWGVEALARGLACNRPRLVVVPYDLVLATEFLRRGGRESHVARPVATAADSSAEAPSGSQQARPPLTTAFEAPANEAERCIAAIWAELLGIDGIGAHDDFFDLGGHSLLATRVLARINEATGVRLALRDVFEAPSVRQLAARLAAAGPLPGGATAAQDEREEIEF
jgi:NAD(P)-dependent dehydrogenase (short-subunit alcohol dehydrogenase family)